MLVPTMERDGGFRMLRKLLFCIAMLVVADPAAADDAMRCFREAGDVAVAACTRAINSGARRPSINYYNRGIAYRDKGDTDSAIADFTEAIRLDPNYKHAYENRGTAYQKKGDNDRAIADFTEAIRLDSKSAFAYNGRGYAYKNKADYDHAIADFTEAIRLDPKSAYAYRSRGDAYWKKDENDRAIADFTQAIRIDPKSVFAYNGRGSAYNDKGDYDHAIADFTEAIRLDPKSAYAYGNRGNAYKNKGDNDYAIADSTEAIQLDPNLAYAYQTLGLAYWKKDENDRAITAFTEAIRLDPKYASAYNNRGLAYRDKGDTDRAIANYTDAIRIDPKLANAYINRGLAYEKLADFDRARSDFNTTLGLPQKGAKWQQDKARERLAALPSTPPATALFEKSNVATANITSTAPVLNNDHRIALVIGNSAYETVAALPNPERDANLVADVLKRTGFEAVTLLTNLRKDALVSALRNFAARAETADWAVVYYAGHGMEVGGINYLIPTDAKIAADRDIGFEAVPLEQVLNAAERAKKLRLVILDACRDNPFANQMKRTLTVASRSVSRGLAAVEPEAGTLVVYAAKDGETALDGDGINSPFASAFVKNLPTPGLEVRRLFDFVRDDVMEATSRKQKPFSYGSISGRQDFYFVAGK
jgi:tetratricopeptide (TPR) repeat protein